MSTSKNIYVLNNQCCSTGAIIHIRTEMFADKIFMLFYYRYSACRHPCANVCCGIRPTTVINRTPSNLQYIIQTETEYLAILSLPLITSCFILLILLQLCGNQFMWQPIYQILCSFIFLSVPEGNPQKQYKNQYHLQIQYCNKMHYKQRWSISLYSNFEHNLSQKANMTLLSISFPITYSLHKPIKSTSNGYYIKKEQFSVS